MVWVGRAEENRSGFGLQAIVRSMEEHGTRN